VINELLSFFYLHHRMFTENSIPYQLPFRNTV
jgi:hypothetical protein